MNLTRKAVNATMKLLDDGATVPFIARYRKEATGELNEVQVHAIELRLNSLRELLKRREFIIDAIRQAGALTDELAQRLEQTLDPATLEDIYLPFKPRRRTRADMAREKGLEPLARQIMAQQLTDPDHTAARFGMPAEEAIDGALDIVAQWVSESEKARSIVRSRFSRSATIASTVRDSSADPDGIYANYYDLKPALLRHCPSHRFLAMRRGQQAGVLKVTVSVDDAEMTERLCRLFVRAGATEACAALVSRAVKDGYKRLLRPAIESEALEAARLRADSAAIELFGDNLRQLLLTPPLFGRRVMGIDPGFRTGCKVVCLDANGNLLAHDVIYPTPPTSDTHGATYTICSMVDRYQIDAIAVGNGTAGRETEKFLSRVRFPRRVQIVMVNEDGASIYSASDLAREEMPEYDLTVRGAASIGRRLLDPLAELVKIEPRSLGVGQYQHDVDQTRLRDALTFTVEWCVNTVGVNVNTASRALLSYVSGIGPTLAKNIVDHRAAHGRFRSRAELLQVARMGEKRFQQCAGFLRIPDADYPLDRTAIHPEQYPLVEAMAADLGISLDKMIANPRLATMIDPERYITKTVGRPTIDLIMSELEKPGRDPRHIEQEEPAAQQGPASITDILPGMELEGKVNNVTAFGAFVDLGIKENGLLHISQLSEQFVTSPQQVVSIGQRVRARVLDVDPQRGRIALSLRGVQQPE